MSGLVAAQSNLDSDNGIAEGVDRLEILQSLIDTSVVAREELRLAINSAAPADLVELQQELETLTEDLAGLRSSFEQVAIGAFDVELLGEIDTAFDWREEVTQILQPIVENLQALTEKPRKISRLQTLVKNNQIQVGVIDSALQSIELKRASASNPKIQSALDTLKKRGNRA